ncbi:MAG: hypothetical protein V1678_04025 [Candidatus Aenigmatarchaeota archaeon]
MVEDKRYSKLEIAVICAEEDIQKRSYPERKKQEKKKYYTYRKRERYPRDESHYNQGQEEEFLIFLEYLKPSVDCVLDNHLPLNTTLEEYWRIHDGLICLHLQRYFGKSLRRSMGIIHYFARREFPDMKVPCFKTLNNYQNDSTFSFYFDKVIEITSQPLKALETRFTTDGTGEGTSCRTPWYSIKAGKEVKKREHMIATVTSTVILNSVIAVDVSDHEDPKTAINHIDTTSTNGFSIEHWSGDSLYLMRALCNKISEKGGQAHLRIKSNTIVNSKGSQEWKRMVTLMKQKDENEIDELNLRQNAESTNSAKKRKFGGNTRSKNDTSRINDIKNGWSCYNFSVLARAYHERNIKPAFLHYQPTRTFNPSTPYT